MIFHECGYEIIAVVVAGLTAEQQWNLRLRAGALQKLGAKLLGQELIGVADIDQQIREPSTVLDERDGIVSAPSRTVIAEIPAERLDAPWHLRRRDNRRKGAGGAIAIGRPQRNREGAMAAHRMPKDRLSFGIDRKLACDQFRKLFRHIAPHPVIMCERLLGGIDVEAGTKSEIIGAGGITGHSFAARAGVRRDEHKTQFRADLQKPALPPPISRRPGQAAAAVLDVATWVARASISGGDRQS